jgi:hypothetical protein
VHDHNSVETDAAILNSEDCTANIIILHRLDVYFTTVNMGSGLFCTGRVLLGTDVGLYPYNIGVHLYVFGTII